MPFLTGASALFCNYLQCQASLHWSLTLRLLIHFIEFEALLQCRQGQRSEAWGGEGCRMVQCLPPAAPAKRQHGLGMMTEVNHSLANPRHDHKPWAQLGSFGDCEFPGVVLGRRLLEMWFCPATLFIFSCSSEVPPSRTILSILRSKP